MTLTFPGAPLASEPPATTQLRHRGLAIGCCCTPSRGACARASPARSSLDSTRGALLHESNILPRLYVPLEDVRADLLERTDHATHCPFKGDASYWSVRVGDRVAENAVWTYEDPIDEAPWLRGLSASIPSAWTRWLDEDEEVAHLRDPYHRVDARRSSRRIEVARRGEVIARSERPWSSPRRASRCASTSRARTCCRAAPERDDGVVPLQGRASSGRWTRSRTPLVLRRPAESMLKARDHVCFDASKVERARAGR